MGTRKVIVVGDTATGGGTVVTGSAETDIDGKPVARVNDKCACTQHKGVFPIVTGDATFIVDGQPVARHGDYLACGCRLMSLRQFRVFIDDCASDAPAVRPSNGTGGGGAAKDAFDEAFILKSEDTGELLVNRRYRIIRESGAVEEGVTDKEGQTHLVKTEAVETLQLEIEEAA